jgi:hypothetical protein
MTNAPNEPDPEDAPESIDGDQTETGEEQAQENREKDPPA